MYEFLVFMYSLIVFYINILFSIVNLVIRFNIRKAEYVLVDEMYDHDAAAADERYK